MAEEQSMNRIEEIKLRKAARDSGAKLALGREAEADLAYLLAEVERLTDAVFDRDQTIGVTEARAEKAESELDACDAEILALRQAASPTVMTALAGLRDRAEKAERERDALQGRLDDAANKFGEATALLRGTFAEYDRQLAASLARAEKAERDRDARPAITPEDGQSLFDLLFEDDSGRTPPAWVRRCLDALSAAFTPAWDAAHEAMLAECRRLEAEENDAEKPS